MEGVVLCRVEGGFELTPCFTSPTAASKGPAVGLRSPKGAPRKDFYASSSKKRIIYNTILSISSTPISPKDVPHRLLLLPPQSRYLTCHLQHLSTLLLSLKVPLEEPAKLLSHLFDLVFPPFFLVTVVEFGEVVGEGVECAKDESSGDVRVLDDAEASDVAVEGDGL